MVDVHTHTQTDNLKSVLEFWIQNLQYVNQFLNLFNVQSVFAPGFFTMASNVVTSSFKDIHPEMARWNHGVIVIMMYYDLYEL